MTPKLLLLALALCVAVVGQDKATCTLYGGVCSYTVYKGVNVIATKPFEHVTLDACMTLYHQSNCSDYKWGNVAPKPELMNVPAVGPISVACLDFGKNARCEQFSWTCPDESWELHTSVNGNLHWCSKPPVLEEKP